MRASNRWALLMLPLALIACGGQPAASPPVQPSSPPPAAAAASPSASAPTFARGSVVVQTAAGPVSMSVEIADDQPKREYGLMNRRSLPPDAGMLFVFNPPAVASQVGFWMEDTLIPLSVAFVEPNMVIESIQDMQPMTRDVHYAPRNYAYAIEANQGFFANRGVAVGDRIRIQA